MSRQGRGSRLTPLPDSRHTRGRCNVGQQGWRAVTGIPMGIFSKSLTNRAQEPLETSPPEQLAEGIRCVPQPSSGEVHLQREEEKRERERELPAWPTTPAFGPLAPPPLRLPRARTCGRRGALPGLFFPSTLGAGRVLWPGGRINLTDLRPVEDTRCSGSRSSKLRGVMGATAKSLCQHIGRERCGHLGSSRH